MKMIDANALAEAMGVDRLMIQSWKADSACGVPIVDAEPVRHGKWMPYEFGDERWRKCSVCGVADKYKNSHGIRAIRKYCPNCGAKMDEVENGRV